MLTIYGVITIYGADRSGDCWDETTAKNATEALAKLHALRKEKPHCVWGVYDSDEPERGDIEMGLEEEVIEEWENDDPHSEMWERKKAVIEALPGMWPRSEWPRKEGA